MGSASSAPECVGTFLGFRPYELQSLQELLLPVAAVWSALLLLRLAAFQFVLPAITELALPGEVKMHRRFKESGWRTVLYGFAAVWCVTTLLYGEDKEWTSDSTLFWKGWPAWRPSDGVFSIYVLYFAMYLHELTFVFIDTSGDDFAMMVAHHLITIALLVASWMIGLTRVGAFMTVLHDVSDFFLAAAKCFNYSKVVHPRMELGADVLFTLFTISFYVLRLGIYPTRVVYSTMFEACEHLSCLVPASLEQCAKLPAYVGFNSLLVALLLLQVAWGWKLARAVYNKVVLNKLEDVREAD